MDDLIPNVTKNADVLRTIVVTRHFNLEGNIHFPRLGKEGRRLSNLLNSEKRFIALTQVQVSNRTSQIKDPQIYSFIEVNIEAIEFIYPAQEIDSAEVETGNQDKTS